MTRQPTPRSVRRRRSVRFSEGLTRPVGLAGITGIAALALTLVLGACTGVMKTMQPGDEPGMTQGPPAGAIQVGEDYYMVPAGTDANGCARFRPWSGSNLVTAAIYYRKADGSFTLNKEQAGCVAG